MIRYRLFTIAAGLSLLFLGGCSENIEPTPLTYSQLLTGKESKTWMLVSYEVIDEGEGSGKRPANELFNGACEADDQFVFYADTERKYEYTNGATKCSAGEPEVLLTDNWNFTNANATLEFAFPVLSTGPLPFIVKSLTETSMTIEIYLDEVQGVDASYRFTLSSSKK